MASLSCLILSCSISNKEVGKTVKVTGRVPRGISVDKNVFFSGSELITPLQKRHRLEIETQTNIFVAPDKQSFICRLRCSATLHRFKSLLLRFLAVEVSCLC